MNIGQCYVGLSDLKTRLDITDSVDDGVLLGSIRAASQQVDLLCKRTFHPYLATKSLTAQAVSRIWTPDLLRIDSLATDDSWYEWDDLDYAITFTGARTYTTAWVPADYDLYPIDAADTGQPYAAIQPRTRWLPIGRASVRITGLWGYWYDPLTITTLAASATDSATILSLTSIAGVQIGNTLIIDAEQVRVSATTADSPPTVTVERGVAGTTAAAHSNAASVARIRYPAVVSEATAIQAARLARRSDAPFGVAGSADMGQSVVIPKVDPDVAMLLQPPLRKMGAAFV